MNRYYYSDAIAAFLEKGDDAILGALVTNNSFRLEASQRNAWLEEIRILKTVLKPYRGRGAVYFEYSIPRLGKRIDVVILIESVIFVLEFKVGEKEFTSHAVDQVYDYALDLKNFHESSHKQPIAPILIATEAQEVARCVPATPHNDHLLLPIQSNTITLPETIREVLRFVNAPTIVANQWELGRYRPTPTIIEAATSLYNGHSVADISRSDASAINLSQTSNAISQIIQSAKARSYKAICFVTGVPGAGKTLVGLDIATKHMDRENDLYSVFLSGNGPLVSILHEALARDKVRHEKEQGRKAKKGAAMSEVKTFIQNVHHFRDECLIDLTRPPIEHVALFDEAQRAWNREQTSSFMLRKKKKTNFNQSEPEFLISCLDRHPNWAVIVCLVGGGQEINTGEAGISEWIESLIRAFPHWHVYISSRLTDSEYAAGHTLDRIASCSNVVLKDELHLAVSMRSFRAEHVSLLVKQLLDLDADEARRTLRLISRHYPIVITRDLHKAKLWLRQQARGSERYGIVASSQAQRLKPHAIDVRSPMDPIHWFLDGKEDVRSSYYLEDVATEFHVQGLEPLTKRRLEGIVTDFDAAQDEERLVDVGPAFVPHPQAAVLVQPAMRPLHHPSRHAQAAAVGGVASGQHRFDPAPTQRVAVRPRVVSAVALHAVGASMRPAHLARHGRDGVDDRQELRYVVRVGGRNRRRQRDAMGVGRDVVLRAVLAAIRGAGSGLGPPKTARTDELSTTARDQSILSASLNLPSSTRCTLAHTPASCQSRRRRQQVMPLPKPSSRGNSSQGMPVRSTKRMPQSTARLSRGLRPGYRRRRFLGGGRMGSISSHKELSRIGLAMAEPPCSTLVSANNANPLQSFC